MNNLNPKAVLLMVVAVAGGYLIGSYNSHLGTDRGVAYAIVASGLFVLLLSRNSRSRY